VARLLVTGTISRGDILDMFAVTRERCDLTFVEYERGWGDGIDRQLYDEFGRLTTWEDQNSADELLDREQPDRLVFLFTTSLNQVVLRSAARQRGIEAVHVEHGYRPPIADEINQRTTARTRASGHHSGLRTHAFFARSLPRRGRVAPSLVRYAHAVKRGGASRDVLRSFADLRRADRYVSFSRECFDHHLDVDRVPVAIADSTEFTGIPQFDDFRMVQDAQPGRSILLVDHQLHNARIFGWDESFRQAWVDSLVRTTHAAGFTLYVKLHPGDRSQAWRLHEANENVQLVERADLVDLSREISVVLGTCSTLQLPFAALPHIAMITLEIHPEAGWFASRRFVETGVAEPVRSFSELATALDRFDEIRAHQRRSKPAFTSRFLEKLDGRAGARLADALGP
jgi:hypothetical protein